MPVVARGGRTDRRGRGRRVRAGDRPGTGRGRPPGHPRRARRHPAARRSRRRPSSGIAAAPPRSATPTPCSPGLRNLLRDRYPDVLEDLLAAGATEIRFADEPARDDDRPVASPRRRRPGALACRRTTFEWVLRRAVLASRGRARSATASPSRGWSPSRVRTGIPVVTGVLTSAAADRRRPRSWPAARRSTLPDWLAAIGARAGARERSRTRASSTSRASTGCSPAPSLRRADGPIGGDLGYLKYASSRATTARSRSRFARRPTTASCGRALVDRRVVRGDCGGRCRRRRPGSTRRSSPSRSPRCT